MGGIVFDLNFFFFFHFSFFTQLHFTSPHHITAATMPISKKIKKSQLLTRKPSRRPETSVSVSAQKLQEDTLRKLKAKKLQKVLKSNRPSLNAESEDYEEEKAEREAKSAMNAFKRIYEQQFGKAEGLEEPQSEEESEQDQNQKEEKSGSGSDEDAEGDYNNSDLDMEMEQYEHYASSSGEESEEESELEESENEQPIVVKHTESSFAIPVDKQEMKLFMSTKAPLQEAPAEPKRRSRATQPSEDEQHNLENDLALQRLIKESHILAEAGLSGVDLSTGITGKARHKTLQSRLDDLGLKKSKPETMPMNIRKGMVSKQKRRHENYVERAKEAGIILARPAKKSAGEEGGKKRVVKRERGLKIASVGRETKHGLIISKSEIARYSGSGGGRGGRKRGGKR